MTTGEEIRTLTGFLSCDILDLVLVDFLNPLPHAVVYKQHLTKWQITATKITFVAVLLHYFHY